MRYVVFDLDQTMADISFAYFFIVSLTMKEFITTQKQYLLPKFPTDLEHQLNTAYHRFVEHVALAELSDQPVGILRPGIIEIMRRISTIPSIHGVAIYSNNQYLPSLHFVRDVIHRALGKPVIGSCIHWDHPCRAFDRQTQPAITKTWETMAMILMDQGAPSTLTPDSVIFFDDQFHPDLQQALQTHYYKVPPYQTFDSLQKISEIYRICLQDVNIYAMYTYLVETFEIEDIFESHPANMVANDILHFIQKETLKMCSCTQRVFDDMGIRIMKRAIREIKIQQDAIQMEKRRTLRKRRRTLKK